MTMSKKDWIKFSGKYAPAVCTALNVSNTGTFCGEGRGTDFDGLLGD
jgi:hypothetical protein